MLGCFSSREFVEIMMLKMGSYNDRLTQAALQVLILAVKSNQSKLTVGHEQLKFSLQPHGLVLSELFEDYESSEDFGITLPLAIHRLLELFISAYEIGLFDDSNLLTTFAKRLLVRAL